MPTESAMYIASYQSFSVKKGLIASISRTEIGRCLRVHEHVRPVPALLSVLSGSAQGPDDRRTEVSIVLWLFTFLVMLHSGGGVKNLISIADGLLLMSCCRK